MGSDDVVGVVGLVAIVVILMFAVAMIGTLLGMFVGWVIHITPLRTAVESGFLAFGVNASGQLVNIGGAVGFVSGLFGGINFSKNNSKN